MSDVPACARPGPLHPSNALLLGVVALSLLIHATGALAAAAPDTRR